ncbi:MAG: PVC-type heme-binding CxxCH protein [Verrucomicrobiota bacterium]
MHKLPLFLLPALCASASSLQAQLPLQKDATFLFYGNSFVERLLEQGGLEAWTQLAAPDKNLHFRSLAWTGDEVGHRLRPEGYAEHLKNLLSQWPAKVVIAGFGMTESFAGEAGLQEFNSQLDAYLKELKRLHPDAKLVLLTPTAVEAKSSPSGVNTDKRNADLALYSAAIKAAAKKHNTLVFDLYQESLAAYAKAESPLTSNGLHLNESGNRILGPWIAQQFVGEKALSTVDPSRVPEVAAAAARKSSAVADVVRPKNGVVYYGVRKRADEYAEEIPRYHKLIEAADSIVHELVTKPAAKLSDYPIPTLPPMAPGKSKPDAVLGVIKPPAEQQKDIAVADGFELNLFASEEQFPELKNPVQIAFDAKGRLWVVTMPSWPHTAPGSLPQDKILVLEDTDHDGKADKCTVFADGLDAVDGIAFHEDGVIISAQPRLFIMRDTDGDGRADSKRELLRGIDVTDSHHGGMIAADPMGHVLFCDGVFHRSQFETPFGIVRGIDSTTYLLDPKSGRVSTEWQSGTPNPWKITFDRQGNPFQMYGDGIVQDSLLLTWTPLGAYHPFGYGKVLGYGKGSGAQSISSPNFPDAYQHGMASATLLGRYFVAISKTQADSGPYVASDRIDVLKSENPAFRPVDIAFGMDGGMYVSDFCSKIIGHAQHPMRDPLWNHEFGRIWRVVSTQKPVVKDWPKIEGASVPELLSLLQHPQDLVREHTRIELRKQGAALLPALDSWVTRLSRDDASFGQSALEALWIYESKGELRPKLLAEALKDRDPLVRSAAVALVRFQANRLPDAPLLLSGMTKDPHPRVRMAVVNVVAHLRPEYPDFGHVLHGFEPGDAPVKQMVADLHYGVKPLKGRSVPILEVDKTAQLRFWDVPANESSPSFDATTKWTAATSGNGVYRTYVSVKEAQTAILSVTHGFLDLSVNGVQILSTDSPWSKEQQAQVELSKGLNTLEVTFRKLKAAPPAVYLYDTLGQRIQGSQMPDSSEVLGQLAETWKKAHSDEAGAIKVQAVPNQMQFAPKELRVKAGQPVRLIFENPDLMLHNLLLVRPGALEEVGQLADKLAAQPDGMAKNYVPDSKQILYATALVGPNGKAELKFDAPKEPGKYPYLCSFPGHWRLMQGTLIVEAK